MAIAAQIASRPNADRKNTSSAGEKFAEACFTSTLISANKAAATSIQLDFMADRRKKRAASAARSKCSTLSFEMRPDLAPQEGMEMHHAVFQRRLVRPGLGNTLLVQRAPPLVHTLADILVLHRGLKVCGLLGLDEGTLEQGDVLGIVELDDVGARLDPGRHDRRHHQHMRIPLNHQAREKGQPDRA